jgi:WD40 repeat protein
LANTTNTLKYWAVVYLICNNLVKKHHCLQFDVMPEFLVIIWCHCRCHPKDINNVVFHRSYPLFASCSDDCTAYVFHGMVYSDLNQNPLIVPLEILRGHANSNGRGETLFVILSDIWYFSSRRVYLRVDIMVWDECWHMLWFNFVQDLVQVTFDKKQISIGILTTKYILDSRIWRTKIWELFISA